MYTFSSLIYPLFVAGRLVKFRWVVPAKGETKIKLHFSSQDRGQFDHTLNFELAGTRRRYQLFCRGLCVVPSICSEPRYNKTYTLYINVWCCMYMYVHVCTYSSIPLDYSATPCYAHCRIVFANRKKTLKSDEIVHKRYVMSKERYYFGPLHCGKTRDRCVWGVVRVCVCVGGVVRVCVCVGGGCEGVCVGVCVCVCVLYTA